MTEHLMINGRETADISAADAKKMEIGQGEKIKVSSRRGEVLVKANITQEVPPGMVCLPFCPSSTLR